MSCSAAGEFKNDILKMVNNRCIKVTDTSEYTHGNIRVTPGFKMEFADGSELDEGSFCEEFKVVRQLRAKRGLKLFALNQATEE